MQLLAMPLLGELAAITGASPATATAGSGGASAADGKGAAPFGQLLAQLQGEGGKQLPPAELAAALGISVEQLQQALAQLRQALADYSRQQTGASGIMPALVAGASEGEVAAVNEDGEAFLLWLADQQQGLAGEVDPALVDALQQWLSEQQVAPTNGELPVAGEQPAIAGDGEAAAALLEAADSAQQVAAEAGKEASAALTAGQAEARAGERQAAAIGAAAPQPAVAAGVVGEQPAQPQPSSTSADSASLVAAASYTPVDDGKVKGDAATDEAASVASASDKRQAPSSVPLAATVTTEAATKTAGGVSEQPPVGAVDSSDAEVSASDGSERRNANSPLTAALTAQQRQGDSGKDSGGQASGRDGGNSNSPASAQAGGEGDKPQLQVGERLSQWQFQWERASNDAASGITTAATSRDSHELRELLGASGASLQPSRLIGSVGQESSPLLRQFSADPAAALGPQVQVMVARSLDQMTVRLDPQELGSMSIKVQVGADQQVHVQFQVSNPATRELVEQSLPKLRELLGDAGVQLADAQVGQQQREARQMAGDSSGRSGDGRGGGRGQGGDGDTDLEQVADQLQRNSGQLANGRLDFYV